MRVYRGLEGLPKFNRAVATMGSFDGVHGGHLVLINRVIERAKELSGESVVLTFDPHPRYVLGTDEGMQLLSTLDEKILLMEQAGIDNLIVIPFTTEFSRQSPAEFLQNYLSKIGIEHFIVGYNHRFGHNKQGDYGYLKHENMGLRIEMVEQQLISDQKVSSTIIREAIESGDMRGAAKLLSHPYIIMCSIGPDGRVLEISKEKLLPPAGIYSIKANVGEGQLIIEENRRLKIVIDKEDKLFAQDKVIVELI